MMNTKSNYFMFKCTKELKTLFSVLLFLFIYSCSPKMIRIATSEDKANFGISKPTKAVFFVENENSTASENQINDHKNTADKIYAQFGGATERVMVGRTNAKTFTFSNGDITWFVDVQKFPKRTAMILFDGKNEPIIEYNTKKYERLVQKYMPEELKKMVQSQKESQTVKKETKSILDSIWAIPFIPDQKYADRIINKSNTIYYPLPFFEDSGMCNGRYETIFYKDAQEKEISYTSKVTYRNGRVLSYEYLRDGIESTQKYYLGNTGLLDSIAYYNQNGKREMKLNFKYLPDQFIVHDVNFGSREEFHLNTKGQVIEKADFDKKSKLKRKIYYTYDQLGRVLNEKSMVDDEIESKSIYQYNSDTKRMYSKLILEGKGGKIISENTTENIGGKDIFSTVSDGKIQYKSVSTLNKNCEGKVTTYDGNGKVVSVYVQKKL